MLNNLRRSMCLMLRVVEPVCWAKNLRQFCRYVMLFYNIRLLMVTAVAVDDGEFVLSIGLHLHPYAVRNNQRHWTGNIMYNEMVCALRTQNLCSFSDSFVFPTMTLLSWCSYHKELACRFSSPLPRRPSSERTLLLLQFAVSR